MHDRGRQKNRNTFKSDDTADEVEDSHYSDPRSEIDNFEEKVL